MHCDVRVKAKVKGLRERLWYWSNSGDFGDEFGFGFCGGFVGTGDFGKAWSL